MNEKEEFPCQVFVTHYLFGEKIYHQLKCNSQKKKSVL